MNISSEKVKNLTPCILTVLFVLFLPAIWANNTMMDASLLPRQLALSAFLLATIPVMVIFAIKGGRFSFNRAETVIFCGLALFMLLHFVSCINVTNGHEAFFHIAKEFMLCMWFFVIYQLLKANQTMRDIMIKTITLTSAIFIGIAFVQLAQADFSKYTSATQHRSYYLSQIMEEIYSTCSNKNLLASLIFITLPTVIYHIVNINRHSKASVIWFSLSIIIAIGSLTLVTFLLTRTVIGALLLSAGVATTILYIYILHIKPRKTGLPVGKGIKIALIVAPVLTIIVGVGSISLTDTQIERTVKERFLLTINPEKYGYRDNEHGESSVAMRKIIWIKTIEMIKEHPLFGSGPGQWQILIPKYGVDEFGEKLREGTLTYQRPHNDYLWIASEVGLLGLLGYFVFYVGIIVIGLVNIKRTYDKKTLAFNILAVSALIGWMFVSMLDYPHERIEHNLVLLTICAIVLVDNRRESKTDEKQSGIAPTAALIATCSAIAIVGFIQTLQFYNGEKTNRRILRYYYEKDWQKIILRTRKADQWPYTVNNYTAPTLFYKGIALAMTGNDDAAIVEYKRALKVAPYHIITYNALGSSYMKLEQYDEAIKACEEALKLSSKNPTALYNMAITYYNKKNYKLAYNYISQIPDDIKDKPENFEIACTSIAKQVVLENRDRYNTTNLNTWLNDDKRIMATIKKAQADGCGIEDILTKELGTK
ncbi:MAG: tetratricopeptide repeat protein [Salinivirgaceae bacterium]|nr:tetratricopeptide repeat protein [Salinivirgaceae bacterium]